MTQNNRQSRLNVLSGHRQFSSGSVTRYYSLINNSFLKSTNQEDQMRNWMSTEQRRRNSSFIRQVMEQVRKEMETNENLRNSVKEFRESGGSESKERLENAAEMLKMRSRKLKESADSVLKSTSEYFSRAKSKAQEVHEAYDKYKHENLLLKNMSHTIEIVVNVTKSSFGKVMDGTSKVLEFFKDEKAEEAKKRAEKWRAEMERKRAAKNDETEIKEIDEKM